MRTTTTTTTTTATEAITTSSTSSRRRRSMVLLKMASIVILVIVAVSMMIIIKLKVVKEYSVISSLSLSSSSSSRRNKSNVGGNSNNNSSSSRSNSNSSNNINKIGSSGSSSSRDDRLRISVPYYVSSSTQSSSSSSSLLPLPSVIQMVVASPIRGWIIAIGTTDSIRQQQHEKHKMQQEQKQVQTPLVKYAKDEPTLELRINNTTRFLPRYLLHERLQGGDLLIAKYYVGKELYDQLIICSTRNSNNEMNATIVDGLLLHNNEQQLLQLQQQQLGQRQNVSETRKQRRIREEEKLHINNMKLKQGTSFPTLLVDPAVSAATATTSTTKTHNNNNVFRQQGSSNTTTIAANTTEINKKRHFLSATTTIRKFYRYYVGHAEFVVKTNKKNNNNNLWDDDGISNRLNEWLNHHRKMGIEHFYIVDNELNVSKPDIQIASSFSDVVTYIRAPGYPYDYYYYDNNSNGKTKTTPKTTVAGQLILENAVLQAANTEWMMVLDLDEYALVSSPKTSSSSFLSSKNNSTAEAYNDDEKPLPKLIHEYAYSNRSIPLSRRRWDDADDHGNDDDDDNNNKQKGEVSVIYAITLHPYIVCTTKIKTVLKETGYPTISYDKTSVRIREGVEWKRKVIVRPDLLSTLSVHYPRPILNDNNNNNNNQKKKNKNPNMVQTFVQKQDGGFAHSTRLEECTYERRKKSHSYNSTKVTGIELAYYALLDSLDWSSSPYLQK